MRRAIVSSTLLLAILAVPVDAQADTRITLNLSSQMVVSGSQVTISGRHSVGESYDWSLYRFEIERLSRGEFEIDLSVRQESAQTSCSGTTVTIDATYRNCSYSIPESVSRGVVESGSLSSAADDVDDAYLQVSAIVKSVEVIGVRAWLDVNDNGRQDAFEPMSPQSRIEILPPEQLRTMLDYEFEPPMFGSQSVRAWAFYGDATNQLIDSSKLSYVVYESTPSGKRVASGSFSSNNHPQIQAFELNALQVAMLYPAIYVSEIWYEAEAGNNTLVASEQFNYDSVGAGSVTTDLTTSDPRAVESTEYARPGVVQSAEWESATYTLTAKGLDGAPLVGQKVYLFIETFDLPEADDLVVDGGYLIRDSRLKDRVILARQTDDNGSVSLDISSKQAKTLGQIGIDFSINGLGSGAWGDGSYKQYLTWAEYLPTITANDSSQAESQWGRDLGVTFTIADRAGSTVEGRYDAVLIGDYPLVVNDSLLSNISSGTYSASIGLSRQAVGSGSSLLTVRLFGEDGSVREAYWRVDWNSIGLSLAAEGLDSKPAAEVDYLNISANTHGTLLEVSGEVVNEFGFNYSRLPIDTSVVLKIYRNSIYSHQLSLSPDAAGKFSAVTPLTEGETSFQAELRIGGILQDVLTCASTCDPGAQIAGSDVQTWTKNVGNGFAKLYAKNVVGEGKVQFFLNGEEIAWVRAVDATDPKLRTANGSAYLVRTVEFEDGKNVLEIFVDGVRTTRTAYTK